MIGQTVEERRRHRRVAKHGAMPRDGGSGSLRRIRVIDAVHPLFGQPLEVSPERANSAHWLDPGGSSRWSASLGPAEGNRPRRFGL